MYKICSSYIKRMYKYVLNYFNVYHKNVRCVVKNCSSYTEKMFSVYLKIARRI